MERRGTHVGGPADDLLLHLPGQAVEGADPIHLSGPTGGEGDDLLPAGGTGALLHPSPDAGGVPEKSAQGILDTLYGGSIRNFFAALYGDAPLSAADREELRQWLDEQ